MKRHYKYCLLGCYLLSVAFSYTQTVTKKDSTLASSKIIFCIHGHFGFIAAHHPDMTYLIKRHIPAFEMNIFRISDGEKLWQRIYKNPEIGLALFVMDLGNPQQLGQAIGVYPYINFPLNPKRKFRFYLRAGTGFGFITKPYEREKNHKNNVIGTYINGTINLRLNSTFNLCSSGKWKMNTGIGLTHFSNGSWSLPNLGMNIPTVNVGIQLCSDTKTEKQRNDYDTVKAQKTFCYFLFAGGGPSEINPPEGKKYPSFTLSSNTGINISQKSRLLSGVELFYNFSNIEVAKRDTSYELKNDFSNLQVGCKFGYELLVGKISLPIEMGVYVYTQTKDEGYFYHRIGIRYFVNKHLLLIYTLKTHWAKADYMEGGVGYRF
ncbi:MAG: acyloxyacyl hydrolase [Bacteroidota bacterium]